MFKCVATSSDADPEPQPKKVYDLISSIEFVCVGIHVEGLIESNQFLRLFVSLYYIQDARTLHNLLARFLA